MHRKCLCPYLCQSMSVCVTIYRDHVWLSSLPVSSKVLSHKVTCHSDMSQWQNHIHVTQGDLMLQQVAATVPNNPFSQGLQLQGRPATGLFTDLSQRHVTSACDCRTRGRNMCATFCCCDMSHEFSNWFEFLWQVTASNCIKTTCHTRRLVAGMCRGDRSPRVPGPLVSFRITYCLW